HRDDRERVHRADHARAPDGVRGRAEPADRAADGGLGRVSTAATRTFDERTLRTLPEAPAFLGDLRERSFEEFRAMPPPSPETEEWRYTDLTAFELAFAPAEVGRPARTTSNQDLEALGVTFCDLDEAAARTPELVREHLHALVPTGRTRFTALHGAFREGGTF